MSCATFLVIRLTVSVVIRRAVHLANVSRELPTEPSSTRPVTPSWGSLRRDGDLRLPRHHVSRRRAHHRSTSAALR